jgi:hypothetical protein
MLLRLPPLVQAIENQGDDIVNETASVHVLASSTDVTQQVQLYLIGNEQSPDGVLPRVLAPCLKRKELPSLHDSQRKT